MLPEVGARAGHDDAQLVGVVAGEFGGLGRAGQFDRAFRAANSAFAVGDQRKQRRLAAHPAGSAQFGQRLGPVAAVVGRDADGLSDRGDPAGPGAGSAGMRQRRLWVVVEEFAGSDEMPRHDVGSGPIQGREFAADLGRQLLGFDVGGNRRTLGRGASPSGLGWARRARSGPEARGAERRGRRRSLPPCLSWTTYAFLHLFASYDNSRNSDCRIVANIESPPTQLWGVILMCVRRCPTFPPGLGSIIGAGRLSFRVRDGSGRFPAAITAVTLFTLF